ncbi:MAG: hypothetical protein AAFU55_16220, partial [Pseudomonadota bacterium]
WDEAIDRREDNFTFTKRILSDGRFDLEGESLEAFSARLCDADRTDDRPMEVRGTDGRYLLRRIISLSNGGRVFLREDVTEDRLIRLDIEEQRARLNAVLGAARIGIFGVLRDGRVAIANPMARRILGDIADPTPFEVPERFQFLNPADASPLAPGRSPIARARAGEIIDAETAILSAGDPSSLRYVRVSSATLPDSGTGGIHIFVAVEDITEQEKNRQQIERAARLDALGQLTGGIAHDFNNLLAVIEYSVQLSDKAGDAKKRAKYNETSLAAVRRGAALTGRLLAFAKRQPGIARSRPVAEIVNELRSLAKPAVQAQVELVFEVPDPTLFVHCDIAQLENALLNLILNRRFSEAAKFIYDLR